jgi:hypothetical protein
MPQQQQRKYSTLRKRRCDAPFICERDPHWQSSHQRSLFGLIHGFGLALALSELAPVSGRIVALLAGFNIGVEIAQLCVVLLVAPVLVRLRQSSLYATRLMPAASVAVAFAGFARLSARIGGGVARASMGRTGSGQHRRHPRVTLRHRAPVGRPPADVLQVRPEMRQRREVPRCECSHRRQRK